MTTVETSSIEDIQSALAPMIARIKVLVAEAEALKKVKFAWQDELNERIDKLEDIQGLLEIAENIYVEDLP